ncbi:ORF6N domain-containing protein [Bacteroidales bacterium OttesenSCG-928-A17]|nr:ORF6N domain-containing protein [Bacteroidales bacterium OttesenSCG-928-A17]
MELQVIQNRIYEIRDHKVMLDFDLAEMYEVETRVLNQAVKRNVRRFPGDFMFQLTSEEWNGMSSQIVMTYPAKRPKTALPFAFTEQGVSMLSSVIRSETAIAMNISIMRAFVSIRSLILNPPINKVDQLQSEVKEMKEYIEEVFSDYNEINEDTRMQLELINESLVELQTKHKQANQPRRPIGFDIKQTKKNSS